MPIKSSRAQKMKKANEESFKDFVILDSFLFTTLCGGKEN